MRKKISVLVYKDAYPFEPYKKYLEQDYQVEYNEINSDSSLILSYAWTDISIKKNSQIPHINILLDVPDFGINNPQKRNFWFGYKMFLRSVSKVLTISEDTTIDLKEKLGIDSIPIHLPISIMDQEKKYRIMNVVKQNQILFVGALHKTKRVDSIFEALNYIDSKEISLKNFPKIVFISNPNTKDLQVESYCKEISNKFNIPFEVKNVPLFDDYNKTLEMKFSKMVIDGSYYAGLGYSGLESIYLGTPCAISDILCYRTVNDNSVALFWRNFKELGEIFIKYLINNEPVDNNKINQVGDAYEKLYEPQQAYLELKKHIEELI